MLLLAVFKYTSNQRAIKRVRDDINANLLALKLFKDSARVALAAQGRILLGAGRLFVLALVPMLVMAVPVTLLLGQLALWYQARPLRVGEDAVITLKLNGDAGSTWPAVSLEPTDAVEVTVGPVRVRSKREVCWNVKAREPGSHRLVFQVGDQTSRQGAGDRRRLHAGQHAAAGLGLVGHPAEPLGSSHSGPTTRSGRSRSTIPQRSSWTSGTDSWVIYWFVVSMVAALCFRRALKVNV